MRREVATVLETNGECSWSLTESSSGENNTIDVEGRHYISVRISSTLIVHTARDLD